MPAETQSSDILLLDDGELDSVAAVLQEMGLAFTRLRGGQITDVLAPPRDLLIVTPRRLDCVRPGSPPEATAGRPLRIIAVQEDSPAMRSRLRQGGLHLLVRLPSHPEIWRLLIRRSLYQGAERREDPRFAVGGGIALDSRRAAKTTLLDLSNRGCRLQSEEPLSIGEAVRFSVTDPQQQDAGATPLQLRGTVRRLVAEPGSDEISVAVLFDPDLEPENREKLTALINRWAARGDSLGPESDASALSAPVVPSCKLPSLPDLVLDDETDPPLRGEARIQIDSGVEQPSDAESERRIQARGAYSTAVGAQPESGKGSLVLIGRDLSAGGMRIENHENIHLGDSFQLALHGPERGRPFRVQAKVARDDGEDGLGLVFEGVDAETAVELEKWVACLPDVESLEDGELSGLGAILSEVLRE